MNILKEIVQEKNISYRELGDKTNIPYSYISKIVNRQTQCRRDLAMRIVEVLGLEEDYGLLILGIVPEKMLNMSKKGLTEWKNTVIL